MKEAREFAGRLNTTNEPVAFVAAGTQRTRIASVDIVRGAVMILMALDHIRDWVTSARFAPEDLSRASVALFATRWVTHFCAPTFFLLSGVGIGILRAGGRPPGALSRFLLARGLWLLVLELFITPIGWQFGFELVPAFALVLWALGWSMILMALAVHLPVPLIACISLAIIAGHNMLDGIAPGSLGAFAGLWRVLHAPGFAIPGVLLIGYPLVPWVAVMALGYVLARVYQWDGPTRRRSLIILGLCACAAFVAIRALNGYGNPAPWAAQRTPLLTVASFLNVRKYPPSLDFLLMTLGPAAIALALSERVHGWWAAALAVYGRVPLFFYVTHIFVAHAAAVILAFVQGGELRRIQVVNNPASIPQWYGLPLGGVYVVWAIVVLLLFYPCRRFAALKNSRRDWWLQYL
jgi:uncharacterized membrane protein